MTLLFAGALLTTFESITGIEAKTMAAWVYERVSGLVSLDKNDNYSYEDDRHHTGLLLHKFLFHKAEAAAQSPDNEQLLNINASSLETAFDWSKYPSQTVLATGYTAGIESTGKKPGHPSYGITYSGVKVKRDLFSTIAADLTVFPIGTILFIPGYGYGVVADKGGAIKGNRLDLYYETVEDVYKNWGKRMITVYVVKQGNGTLTEKELILLNEDKTMQVFRQQYILKSS